APSPEAGRLDTNSRYEPSGVIAGSRSRQCPEKDAGRGVDQSAPTRCASNSAEPSPTLRMTYTVAPSGVNATAPLSPVPEMLPGANTMGVAALPASAEPVKASRMANIDGQRIGGPRLWTT